MKKIIFVCSEFKIGGVETSFNNWASFGIDKNKYQLELHLINQKEKIDNSINNNVKYVNIESIYDYFFEKKTLRDALEIIKQYGLYIWLKRLFVVLLLKLRVNRIYWLGDIFFPKASNCKCDVCVVLKENDPCLYYALSKIKAKKVISFFHTAKYFIQSYGYLYESSKIDQFVTVSKGNKEFLLSKMPKLSGKLTVIHNIINPKEIKEKSMQPICDVFDDNYFNLVSVGRICQNKGIETIIATASLLNKTGKRIKWYLIGPFDEHYTKETFLKEIHHNNVEEMIKIVGPTSNPYPYMASSKVLVNPSLIESFGMAIREAQILGIPVIATRTYGGNELIEDGITGLLVDINVAEELAEKIILLMSDHLLYSKIRNNLKSTDFDETGSIKEQFERVIDF